MLDKVPGASELTALLGEDLYTVWNSLCHAVEERYDMERLWDKGYREWVYEYKYRRGGKTLCTLYAKENAIGFLVIFGKAEREKVEAHKGDYSEEVYRAYEEAKTFHDGKWVMVRPTSIAVLDDLMKLLVLKRRPNRK